MEDQHGVPRVRQGAKSKRLAIVLELCAVPLLRLDIVILAVLGHVVLFAPVQKPRSNDPQAMRLLERVARMPWPCPVRGASGSGCFAIAKLLRCVAVKDYRLLQLPKKLTYR